MKGVQFLTDEHGNPKSIVLDIEEWGELCEDIYDIKAIEAARKEDGHYTPWETLEAELDAKLAAMNTADN